MTLKKAKRVGDGEGVAAAMSDLHPGACFKNFLATAAECKVCFVADSCEDATSRKSKLKSEPEEKEVEVEKTPLDALVEAVCEEGFEVTASQSKPKCENRAFGTAGKSLAKISFRTSDGAVKVTIGEKDPEVRRVQTVEDAKVLAGDIVEAIQVEDE